MKKTILILTALLLSANVFGQKKGEINVGGRLGFESESTTSKNVGGSSTKQKVGGSFKIGANADYFVIDNLAVSLGLGFETEKSYKKTAQGWKNMFGISAAVSYYFRIVDKFYWTPAFFIKDYFGGTHTKDGNEQKRVTGNNEFSMGLNLAALEFRFNDHFSLYGSCGKLTFSSECIDDLDGWKTFDNTWKMDLSNILAPEIGFRYWF